VRSRAGNPKFEARISKQIQNPKFEIQDLSGETGSFVRRPSQAMRFEQWVIRILNLFRISDFEFRIWDWRK